jgi:hypothetical protein
VWRKTLEYEQDFASLVRLTQIGCKMFRWTEANISYSNLSVVVTCEHGDSASSPTRLQLMGGGRESGEPNKYSPDIPVPMALEDPRAGAASPRATLSGTPAPAPCTTKSCNKLPMLSPSRGRDLPPQHRRNPAIAGRGRSSSIN